MEQAFSLDWSAPRRWVHIDNVREAQTGVFESARIDWLALMRNGDRILPDGRALFWQRRGIDARSYYTFYPFGKYAELDARLAATDRTFEIVGEQAIEAYNQGDAGIIDHYSQIWTRRPGHDVNSPVAGGLNEMHGAGRLH